MWDEATQTKREVQSDPVSAIRRAFDDDLLSVVVDREWRNPEFVGESIGFGFGPDRLWQEASVSLAVSAAQQEPFFVSLCELLLPRHGRYIPDFYGPLVSQDMTLEMALRRDYGMYGYWPPESPNMQLAKALASVLPRLRFSMPDPSGLPNRLGWLNYWHEDVAKELGFPDPDKDARILSLCQRTDSGAWLVKLTAESLDLTRPDHVEAIVWAYWRFDKVGKRMQPTAKKVKPRVKKAEADAAASQGMKVFVLRERDESGQWWDAVAEPIRAPSADEALRIYFAKTTHSREPRPTETLNKLRKSYDAIAAEVGFVRSDNIDAVEAGE